MFWQSSQLDCLDHASPANMPARNDIQVAEVSLSIKQIQPKSSGTKYRRLNGMALDPTCVREFPVLERPFPCFPAELHWNTLAVQQSPATQGFLYVKARKASSSTVAGVALRIARKFAQERNVSTPICQVRFNHPMASRLGYSKRQKMNSFLWTILREPTNRFISEFFHFGLSRNFIQPTDENIRRYMMETRPSIDNYYLRWLSLERPFEFKRDHDRIPTYVHNIVHEYDFVGISERLDESLVALQIILNLNTSDILYLSAKVNGGWDDGVYRKQCYYITPSFVSESMKEYFETSEEWYNFSVGDDLLYRAANASLDRTIASLDKMSYASKLQKFRWAINKAEEVCRNQVTFPCSSNGNYNEVNDCLMWDSGCGMDCLDNFARDFGL